MSWALIGLRLMGFGKAVLAWLSRRSLAELACIALMLFAGWAYLGKLTEQRHANHLQTQLNSALGELNRLREQSKAQQKEVGRTVDHYITVEKPVIRKEVERIESAPLPGNCRTPDAVRNADV